MPPREMQICTATMEISVAWRLLRKRDGSSYTTLGRIPKECFILPQDTCTAMLAAALFIIDRS